MSSLAERYLWHAKRDKKLETSVLSDINELGQLTMTLDDFLTLGARWSATRADWLSLHYSAR